MSEKREDGGPAFPHSGKTITETEFLPDGCAVQRAISTSGMSLRDYFAAAALTGILAASGSMRTKDSEVPYAQAPTAKANAAFHAYAFADAMLEARNE